jgi:hypothetical protein
VEKVLRKVRTLVAICGYVESMSSMVEFPCIQVWFVACAVVESPTTNMAPVFE